MPIVSLRPASRRSDRTASQAAGSGGRPRRAARRTARAFSELIVPAARISSVRAFKAMRQTFVR